MKRLGLFSKLFAVSQKNALKEYVPKKVLEVKNVKKLSTNFNDQGIIRKLITSAPYSEKKLEKLKFLQKVSYFDDFFFLQHI